MHSPCGFARSRFWAFCLGLLAATLLGRAQESKRDEADLEKRLTAFVTAKEEQARSLASELKLKLPAKAWDFFEHARGTDWIATSNLFNQLVEASGRTTGRYETNLASAAWQTLSEVDMALEEYHLFGAKHTLAFGDGIINSLPKGALYFGGTDPGRGLVTALSSSHVKGEPFFTVTQNALADDTYLSYLRLTYGRQIKVPTIEDLGKAFTEYSADAAVREAEKRLRPGEEVTKLPDGRISVSGQTAVMDINGRLVRMFLEKNPDRELFIEESFPLDWMYPHLTPHGLVLKLNREPLKKLSAEIVDRDHEHWGRLTEQLLGRWLLRDTPFDSVRSFCRRVYGRKDLGGFEGDRSFMAHPEAGKSFGKLRLAQAGVYQWRADNTEFTDERKAMTEEATLAFHQALALGALDPEIYRRYSLVLHTHKRTAEARSLVALGRELLPDEPSLQEVEKILKRQP